MELLPLYLSRGQETSVGTLLVSKCLFSNWIFRLTGEMTTDSCVHPLDLIFFYHLPQKASTQVGRT